MSNVYSPREVDISIFGQTIAGWDSITITRNSENATTSISADGVAVQTYSADSTGMFDIEVQQQNSPVNSFMSAVQGAQDLKQDLLYMPITVQDKSGGVFVRMADAFLNMPANMDLTTEQTSRTWSLYVNTMTYLPNPSGSSTLAGIATAENVFADLKTKLGN